MVRTFIILSAALGLSACGQPQPLSTVAPESNRWRAIEVTNRNDAPVQLYPALSGTTLWTRIGGVPPHTTRRVRVPAAYLRRDFAIVVCRSSPALADQSCVRTGRYQRMEPIPKVVVFPTARLHAELYG
jgi:hypothetical protein